MEILKTWTVKRSDGKGTRSRCTALCDCGSLSEYDADNIKQGNTTRCQNCASTSRGSKKKTHGCSSSFKDTDPEKYATYTIWQAMKRRCGNLSDRRYSDYGGRGIKVCSSWTGSFDSFLFDMGFRPSKKHQIDRIENNGNYEPSNCRWVLAKVNARNKRNNRVLDIDGESKCVAEWSDISKVSSSTIFIRLKRGWCDKQAVFGDRYTKIYNTPEGRFKTLKEVQDFYLMSSSGVHGRFKSKSFESWTISNVTEY